VKSTAARKLKQVPELTWNIEYDNLATGKNVLEIGTTLQRTITAVSGYPIFHVEAYL
jgi:hypothetical protein